jgi:hypothetical protein
MRKWVTFGLVAVGSLALAAVSSADVPSELTSTVTCYCTALAAGGASQSLPDNCTISPDGGNDGDEIHVDVHVRNILGQDLQNSTVTVVTALQNGAAEMWCDSNTQVGLSDAGGLANFVYYEGSVIPASPTPVPLTPTLDFDVDAVGPGAGGAVALEPCENSLTVISPEVSAGDLNLLVSSVDFTDFGDIFNNVGVLGDDHRGDLDHDRAGGGDVVDGVDFTIYASHHGKTCAP